MTISTVLLLVFGLVLLVFGAESLIAGGARLARRAGISSLVVGLTVVAFGTSSPELAVALDAVRSGAGPIALGNAIGSNIFNTLAILGLTALVLPIIVHGEVIRRDLPVMVAASVMPMLAGLDGRLSRFEGILMLVALAAYLFWLFYSSRRKPSAESGRGDKAASEPDGDPAPTPGIRGVSWDLTRVAAGLAMLILGSRWLVDSASEIAQAAGVSELVIGLTIVGAGTSLPELATSILAALRGQRDMAVGNVVGSNIFNMLCILGAAATFTPDGAGLEISTSVMTRDLPLMIASALICIPIFLTGRRISRMEGAGLLTAYVLYVIALIYTAGGVEA